MPLCFKEDQGLLGSDEATEDGAKHEEQGVREEGDGVTTPHQDGRLWIGQHGWSSGEEGGCWANGE